MNPHSTNENTPIALKARALCYAIEELPASEQQTSISLLASELSAAICAFENETAAKKTASLANAVVILLEGEERHPCRVVDVGYADRILVVERADSRPANQNPDLKPTYEKR